MREDDKRRYFTKETVIAVGATVIWYLFAHGYRFANNMYSHDALLEVCQDDSAWQIALGRFLQPVLIFLRGGLCSPWLISVCAMAWICLGSCLLVHLLKLKQPLSIVLIAGVMVCNPTLISTNASFLPWLDFYGLALFLSILGVWLCKRGGWRGSVCGVVSWLISMGIYQAYICVAIVLVMILLLREAMENKELKTILKKAVHYGAMLFLSALLYYAAWRIMLSIFHIWTADTYNGMASLGDYSEISFLSLLALTYERVFQFFWNPDTFVTMKFRGESLSIVWKYILRFGNCFVAVGLIGNIIAWNIKGKAKLSRQLFQAGLLLLLPLGMNFVCILSKGMVHTLMIYAFVFLYVLAVAVAEADYAPTADAPEESGRAGAVRRAWKRMCSGTASFGWRQIMAGLPILLVVWSNVVYANQTYLKKELQERAVTSMMTRIVAEIEGVEGYLPGVTPVAFSGVFEDSPYLQEIAGFEELRPYGMKNTALTYMGTDYAFLRYEVSVRMNYTRIAATEPEVMEMPAYPAKGSIGYVGDVLVIKISE